MSIFDDSTNKNCEKSFAEGNKAGRSGSFGDDIVEELSEVIGMVVPSTKERQSYHAGYRAGMRERGMGEDKTSDSGGSGSNCGDYGDSGTYIDSISNVSSPRKPLSRGWKMFWLSLILLISHVIFFFSGPISFYALILTGLSFVSGLLLLLVPLPQVF